MTQTIHPFFAASAKLAKTAALCGLVTLGIAQAQSLRPVLPFAPLSVSIVPPNGDVNPYGVAFVPIIPVDGIIRPGDVLVSNFNNSQNMQGTGTTIVRVTPTGQVSQFFQGQAPGMTAALGVLADGIVIVGSLPTTDGTSATVQAGSLLAIDRFGKQLGSIANGSINGPWGMAISDKNDGTAQIFVSNVLAGTVVRFDVSYSDDGETLTVNATTTIGTGFSHRTDPAALVLGPSGLYYEQYHDVLYVASSIDNAVYTLAGAGAATSSVGSGTQLFQDYVHLHGPLDITAAPNGHLLIANSDGSNVDPNQPSELTEYTFDGKFVAQFPMDPNNGAAFGLNTSPIAWNTVRVAAVSDNANTLFLWTTVLN